MIQISELLLKNNDEEIFLAIQKESEFSFDSFIWGYHAYKETWQNLKITVWVCEDGNKHDESSGFRGYLAHLLSPSPKNRKSPNPKFLIFQEKELLDSKIKKCLIYLEMQPFIFQPKLKNKKQVHPKKISYTSRNGNPEKINIFSKESFSYISGNRNP